MHRNTWGLLIGWKRFLCVLLFQENLGGDRCTEPKTDPGSAKAKLSLQPDGDPGSTPGISSKQLPAKADQLDPPPAASEPPAAGSSLQPFLRRPPSPIVSLDRCGDGGGRPTTHLTSTDILKTSRFYQK